MLFKNILLALISFSVVLSLPLQLSERDEASEMLVARASKKPAPKPAPAKPAAKGASGKASMDDPNYTSRMRQQNNAPGREVPKTCKKLSDCSCPKNNDPKKTSSTSCINGVCKCDDPVIGFIGNKFIESVKAIGNAAITKVIGEIMSGIATAKQVASTIAGAVLGPQAKAALKVALNAIPDTGPSHIDRASKNIINKVL